VTTIFDELKDGGEESNAQKATIPPDMEIEEEDEMVNEYVKQ